MSKSEYGGTSKNVEAATIDNSRTHWRNLFAYWMLGLCNNYGYVVMLSAAQDIVSEKFSTSKPVNASKNLDHRTCNEIATGAILLADVLPSLFVKMTISFMPFFVHVRMATAVLFSAAGFLLVALGEEKWVVVMGVVLTSIAAGIGEVTLLGYSRRFSKLVISTWSSGTGGAGLIGALSYLGLKKVLSTKHTMLVMLVVPLVEAIIFWLVLVHSSSSSESNKDGAGSQEQIINTPKLTTRHKLQLVPKLLKYMLPLGLVYFFEYFINHALFELIEFRGIFLDHNEQYRWYQSCYQIGVFISRSSVNLIHLNKIWIMSVLQFANVIILMLETWYYYIPSIWIVFALILWEGLLGGGAYVNTFYKMSKEIPWEEREASMGITTIADAIGISLAGWVAMPVHNYICELPLPQRLGG